MMDTGEGELEYRIAYYLMMAAPPVLIIFGTIGNLLSILVMSRRNMRSSNASVYLITLAIADIGALYFGLLLRFIDHVEDRTRKVSEPICKINIWMMIVTLDVSAWILVAFTIERFLSVYFPHKFNTFCKQKCSIVAVICIVVVILAHNGHILYGFGDKIITYENTSLQFSCTIISDDYFDFLYGIFPWISVCVNCVIPVIIFIICNSSIAIRVFLRRRNMQQITDDKATKNLSRESLATSGRQENHSRLTIILFTVTIVFLITTVPIRVFYIILPWLLKQAQTYKNVHLINLVYVVIYILMYINNSVNFILYCVTGSKFRGELRNMFKDLWNRIVIKHPTNDSDNVCSRRPSLVARQIVSEVTELAHEELLSLPCDDHQ